MAVILVIDNYDSFTFNLVQYLGELGAQVEVVRNDRVTPAEVAARAPDAIVISPGPGRPRDSGIAPAVVRQLGHQVPILGVCLGHQVIAEVYGGQVVPAPQLMHGKTSPIRHWGDPLFAGLPNPFPATRYHSLTVDPAQLPAELTVTAETPDGVVMGLRHRRYPVVGVQFHPESVLTEGGRQILDNFLATAAAVHPGGNRRKARATSEPHSAREAG